MQLHNHPGVRPLKVLVAEDNVINQRIVIGLLTSLGHTGVVVGDGEKALRCLSKLKFDVVLMDVMMPLMDGLQALAQIRAEENGSSSYMPIIMATSHDEPGDRQRFQQAGADGYVPKPIQLEQLEMELARVVGLRR
jgi:CheY-like chemotaxis protein